MAALLFIPILLGLVAWYLTNFLADTLPFLPEKGPKCTNTACRQTIPMKDYFLLRRCAHCGKPRPVRFWVILALMLAASIYLWLFPPGVIGFAGGLILFTYLVTVAVVDLEHHLILRPLSITGVVLGIATGFLMRGWQSMLLGAVAGFIILLIFYLFGKLFSRFRNRRSGADSTGEDALGSGDVTLAVILGLMVGWPLIWFNILLGVLCAGAVSLVVILWLVFSRRYGKSAFMVFIPLGPGFILATMIILYFPHYLSSIVAP